MLCLAVVQPFRLLLIEADAATSEALARRLTAAGHRVERATSWREGLIRAVSDDYHLILLDAALPEVDGAALIRILRACGLPAPMLLLSAADSAEGRAAALAAGATDVLAAPFTGPALLARVSALARTPPARDPPTTLRVADLELDLATRTVARGGRAIQLSPRHFDLLACLMRNRGQAVRRETLLKAVRGQRRDPGARILETSIAQLRAKVDRGFGVELIHPVPGIGYCLLDEE